jgi:hypothetical protein
MPILVGERPYGLLQRQPHFLARQEVFLGRRLVRPRRQRSVVVDLAAPLQPAPVSHDFVARDPEGPRQTISATIEVGDARTDPNEHLLRDVLCVCAPADPALSERQDHGPQLVEQGVESGSVAVSQANHRFVDCFSPGGVHA